MNPSFLSFLTTLQTKNIKSILVPRLFILVTLSNHDKGQHEIQTSSDITLQLFYRYEHFLDDSRLDNCCLGNSCFYDSSLNDGYLDDNKLDNGYFNYLERGYDREQSVPRFYNYFVDVGCSQRNLSLGLLYLQTLSSPP